MKILEQAKKELGKGCNGIDLCPLTYNGVLKIIDEHILKDDYMGIDTKQSLKELREKFE